MSRKHKFWTQTGWSESQDEKILKRAAGEGEGGNRWKVLRWERGNIHCPDTDRIWMEQGHKLPGCRRKTSAMDWKSIRKTPNIGIGEPVSQFTCVAPDAAGRWMRWEQGRISRDLLELLKPHRQETGGA